MKFAAKLAYLVNTKQASDFKAAQALIVRPAPVQPKPESAAARFPYNND